jgi:hypothetical protein
MSVYVRDLMLTAGVYVVQLKINRHILAGTNLLFTVYYVQCASESLGVLICPGMKHRGPSFILIACLILYSRGVVYYQPCNTRLRG